jgi:hypothetical protein
LIDATGTAIARLRPISTTESKQKKWDSQSRSWQSQHDPP